MKRKKIILWSIFAVNAIGLMAVLIDALLEKNPEAAALYWVMISIGFVFVKLSLDKDEVEKQKNRAREEKTALFLTSKRGKIILWSVFVFSTICMGVLMIEAILEKNFKSAAISWFMISIGFISVKYLLPKVEKKEKQEKELSGVADN